MLKFLQNWQEDRRAVSEEAKQFVLTYGAQARFVLAEQIRERLANSEDCRRAWAVMKLVRRLSKDDGVDTATRMVGRDTPL